MDGSDRNDGSSGSLRPLRLETRKPLSTIRDRFVSPARCAAYADSFSHYLQSNPHKNILGARYDDERGCFIVTHRTDGEFEVSPNKFITVVATVTIQHTVRSVTGRVDAQINALLGRNEPQGE